MNQVLTKDEIIAKIFKDPLFKNAEKYKDLLKYLYTCYKNDKIPTEFEIAANVFFKDKEFNPADDTTVRVYIYRLRKKLNEYYEGNGKQDSRVIQIQKGTYHIEFIKHSELNKRKIIPFKQYTYPAIILFLLLIITFLSIEFISLSNQLNKKEAIQENELIWSTFTNTTLPTLYCVGSLYAYYYYFEEFDRSWLVRDDAINNELELNNFEEKFQIDKDNISIPDWKIIPESAAIHYGRLLPIFNLSTTNFDLIPTDELTWDKIENNNIVYVGHFHNLNILKTIFPNNRLKPQTTKMDHGLKEYFIKVQTSEIDTLYPIILNMDRSQKLDTDYVIVSKVPGPRNNSILFICSFSSMGRLKLVETLTSAEMLDDLQKNILKERKELPQYFEMLVKVSGFLDIGLETDIIHFFELPSDFILIKEQSDL